MSQQRSLRQKFQTQARALLFLELWAETSNLEIQQNFTLHSENLLLIWRGIWAQFFMLNKIQIVPNILFKKAVILDELTYSLLVKHYVKIDCGAGHTHSFLCYGLRWCGFDLLVQNVKCDVESNGHVIRFLKRVVTCLKANIFLLSNGRFECGFEPVVCNLLQNPIFMFSNC